MLRLGLLLGLTAVVAADTVPLPPVRVTPIDSPVPARAVVSTVCRSESQRLWISWIDSQSVGVSSYNEAIHRWSSPKTIGLAGATGTPSVASHRADLCVVWGSSQGIQAILSKDEGSSWTSPIRIALEGTEPIAAALADGGYEIAWLVATSQGKATVMAARVFANGGATNPVSAAEDASAGCPIALAGLLDGGALLAYRSLADNRVVDPRMLRLRRGAWGPEKVLASDGWMSPQAPIGGPSLAVDGGRVAVSWFCGGDHDPRVLISGSPDAGERFLMPLTLDDPVSDHTPATALLHDGAYLSIWANNAGHPGLWFRRTTPDFSLQAPVRVGEAHGEPQSLSMALVADYSGGVSSAEALAFASWKDGSRPSAYLIEVPEGAFLQASDPNCHCAPTPAELVGYPVRGRVVSRGPTTVTFTHTEIPGVMDEGTTECLADPTFISSLEKGYAFLGRIERRSGQWRLYDIRILVERADAPVPPSRGF